MEHLVDIYGFQLKVFHMYLSVLKEQLDPISITQYLYIIEDDGVVHVVVILAALCILSLKINDDVPIKNETTARIFPVMPGMRTSGSP